MSTIPRGCRTSSIRRAHPWSAGGCEPRLDEVLADPIVHQIMRRDGVAPDDLRTHIARVRARRGRVDSGCLCAA